MSNLYVLKRDGRQEEIHFDKITSRIKKLCYGLDSQFVDAAAITMKVRTHTHLPRLVLGPASRAAPAALRAGGPAQRHRSLPRSLPTATPGLSRRPVLREALVRAGRVGRRL